MNERKPLAQRLREAIVLYSAILEDADTHMNLLGEAATELERIELVRTWYSTTKEGATEKHPFKEPVFNQLVFGGRLYRNEWIEAEDRYTRSDSFFVKTYQFWCDRYEDSPPTFEE